MFVKQLTQSNKRIIVGIIEVEETPTQTSPTKDYHYTEYTIKSTINGKPFKHSTYFFSQVENLLKTLKELEDEMLEHMAKLSQMPPEKKWKEALIEMGYETR